ERFRRAGDENSAQFLARMNTQLNKLTGLINDLLDVTKLEAGKLDFSEERFDFNTMVTEIVEEIQPMTNKHALQTKLTATKSIWGDRDRIGQVLTNFLTNAIKYSPKADKVIITTSLTN